MAKTPKQKLAVDGTAKLAAKAKPGDKHEQPDLNIEEATVASPRETRRRAGDYFDFDGGDPDEPENSGKATDTKDGRPKRKKTKAVTSDIASKGAKANKSKNATDASAEGETIGDRVKAETEKPTRSKKAEPADKDIVIGPSGDTVEVEGTAKTAPSKRKDKSTKSGKSKGEPADAAKDDSVADRVAAETTKSSKRKREKPLEKDVVIGPSGDTAGVASTAPESKDSKPKKAKAATKDKPEVAKASKSSAKDDGKAETSKAKGATAKSSAKDKGTDSKAKSKVAEREARKEAKKDAPQPEDSTVNSDHAMDQAPFDSLVESGKDKVSEGSNFAKITEEKASKAKKETKKGTEKVKKAAKSKEEKAEKKDRSTKHKDVGHDTPESAEPSTTAQTKSNKRKAPAAADAETVKSNILDPLAEHASESAKKKQKKDARKSIGKSVGDLVNSGLEAAAESAHSLRESIGGLTGGAEKPITNFTPEVAPVLDDATSAVKTAVKKGKGKAKAAADAIVAATTTTTAEDEGDASDSEPNDQTAALLKGFESSGDEKDAAEGEGFKEGDPIPSLPNTEDTEKKLKAVNPTPETEVGVVYLGRIPHGFYEHQMRSYFTQFGPISRLRLSRSRATGRSKHYAFIEFENEEVAKIVAGTMDNYLMFGHILKCKMVAKGDQHESMWKGANKRFKKVPWNQIEGRKLEVPAGKSQWTARKEREEKKRAEKLEQTKAIGYEFVAPVIKGVDEVQKKIDDVVVARSGSGSSTIEQEKSLVTAGDGVVVVSEEIKTKKSKKDKKGKVDEIATTSVKKTKRKAEEVGEAVESAVKKAKKTGKKAAA
ncbi:MAG: hypothetical protein Q9217_005453 [Psora testacea]